MFYFLKSVLMPWSIYATDFYVEFIYASTNAFGVKQKPLQINYNQLLQLALFMFFFLAAVIGSYYVWEFFIKSKKRNKSK